MTQGNSSFQNEAASGAETLSARTAQVAEGGAHLWMISTNVRDVISFRGSFETAPSLAAEDDLTQHLVVDLLDKGTLNRDRFEIAEALEGRGAQLSFYADTLRVGFAGKVLKDDLPDVLAILAEQLREPLFDADEFAKEQAKAIAGVQNAMDSTASQASGALKRLLFSTTHPNYVRPFELEIAELEKLNVDAVRAYHTGHFGSDALKIAFAGDLDPDVVSAAVSKHLGDWKPRATSAQFSPYAEEISPSREDVLMADKQNLDVSMGHALELRRDDDDFLPLYVGNAVLGGNFSARLMQIVRDEMGLTYGIGSSLSGIAVEHSGYWKIDVSLSSENLDRGVEATQVVIRDFVSGGISAEELDEKKTTLAGNHVVGMATTSGLTARLLVNAERGFAVSYLDDYPELVRELTLEQINETIRRHFDPDALSVVVAGTLPKDS